MMRFAKAGLAGVCVVLAALVMHVATMTVDTGPLAPPPEEPGLPNADPDAGLASILADSGRTYPETLARPLFRPDRRPPAEPGLKSEKVPEAASSAPAEPLPAALELVGVMTGGGWRSRALIRSGDAPAGTWVEVGSRFGAWRVTRIDAASVTLEARGRTQNLPLFPLRRD